MTSRKWFILGLFAATACGKSTQTAQAPRPAPAPTTAAAPTVRPSEPRAVAPAGLASNDPRVGLKPGLNDAGQVTSNLKLDAHVPSPEGFAGITNSDIAFTGNYALQGNYNGLQIWDVSNPSNPTIVSTIVCPASQNDVSVYKQQLLFMSAEAPNARLDCGKQGFPPGDSVDAQRIRGVRIFDITDIRHPKYITSVQTCRGSHTHTLLEDPKDPNNLYIYV